MYTHFFIDFDSTIISGEILDILADISLANHPNKSEICQKIAHITELGMTGHISFSESLSSRIALLQASHHHILLCINRVQPLISRSFGDFCNRMKQQ
jgi:D-3-phosphoglycerate dehydrogenase / 2-oxoglutarate reductase